ncbi:glycerate kinase [Herbiconiux moechotypicola]|uniref:Glycerate kinase n=1 Tax=Herbiconiux moechotypicola TaxID=637393 RepID=A0ABP5QL57_9MICO|nr:glycerate kinase [Herbiconiux moechotypicola]MCS5731405.1 glycerate kinase [Herbiconiux moechotypicola]
MSARVVFAPDSFKGTISAAEAAECLAEGWRSVRPHDEVVLAPMADGGEGVLDAVERSVPGSERRPVTVTAPDDRVVESSWLLLPAAAGEEGPTGVIELASTSGITMLPRLRPLEAHTLGFGQAVRAALDAGVHRLVLAIGGSASTDGGAGLLAELGARLLRADGTPAVPGNAGLGEIARVDLSRMRSLPAGGAVVLGDVTNPLLGRDGAVAVFGPQKGIGVSMAAPAEARLAHFAGVLQTACGTDPEVPGTGAAGGTGFALLAWGAGLQSGAEAVAEVIGLARAVQGADAVVTGEGRYDGQSESGKVPSQVRSTARSAGASALLVAGAFGAEPQGFDDAVSLVELATSSEGEDAGGELPEAGAAAAMADPHRWLRTAGAVLAERFADR